VRTIDYTVQARQIIIRVAETAEDLGHFQEFSAANPVLGWDTETTGLDWWAGTFRCRLVQFGTANEAWVLPVELGEPFAEVAAKTLRHAELLVAHHGTYDMHVAERCLGVPMEELASRSLDTKLLAHLVDPRALKEGGPGLKLEELIGHYIDAQAAAEVKGSMAALARKHKVTKEKIWAAVDLFDPDYLLYAGMDPVWVYRLLHILLPKVPARSRRKGLISWEHRVAHIGAKYERNGLRIDGAYARARSHELTEQQRRYEGEARRFGVENVGSNQQLAEAFTRLGVNLTKKTAKGNLAMDDTVLSAVDHPLATAVKEAKKAAKWRATWFDRALAGMDSRGMVHASINTCQARTARMSISGSIPAQTFPKGSGYVRSCFIAEPGHVLVSTDYANMELRFLAADSGDQTMLEAFHQGLDLHQMTADAAGVSRAAGKGTNFTVCYGGGWRAVVEQYGVSEDEAKKAVKAFWDTYPGVKRLSDRLQREARRYGYIWTATGRRLPVDQDRPYAALNYRIQSSCRDVTARAMVELDRHGYSQYVKLPIHDEFIFSFPEDRAEEMAEATARLMEFTYKGLLIPAEPEIAGRSWGDLYDGDTKH
jgi:DNA polymerase-1